MSLLLVILVLVGAGTALSGLLMIAWAIFEGLRQAFFDD